jgi:hypothetical protein
LLSTGWTLLRRACRYSVGEACCGNQAQETSNEADEEPAPRRAVFLSCEVTCPPQNGPR